MKEPSRFFNFQMPYEKYEQLETISRQNDCSIAEIVRAGVDKVISEYNTDRKLQQRGK